MTVKTPCEMCFELDDGGTCVMCGTVWGSMFDPHMNGLYTFVVALNSGLPFRREGSTDSEGEPIWWERQDCRELLRDTTADDFMRLLNVKEWEIQGRHGK
jgi:hypothetical protein